MRIIINDFLRQGFSDGIGSSDKTTKNNTVIAFDNFLSSIDEFADFPKIPTISGGDEICALCREEIPPGVKIEMYDKPNVPRGFYHDRGNCPEPNKAVSVIVPQPEIIEKTPENMTADDFAMATILTSAT